MPCCLHSSFGSRQCAKRWSERDRLLVLAGEPAYLRMPAVFGVGLQGELPLWVSAKDVILGMLRRHGLEGGLAGLS